MTKYLYILLFALALTSCSSYQKALKSEDVKVQYAEAEKQYDKGKYDKAIRLFDKITPSYKGMPQAEKLFYMEATAYYKTKQYPISGYKYEEFAQSYSGSTKAEEAAFLSAKSYYMLSPVFSKDQTDTYTALDKLQNFIDKYPNSQFMPEANELVKELREKLEKKAYEIAMQYYKTAEYFGDYNAPIKAFDNFIIDYPGTKYKEDALYYKFDASYRLAINSVRYKMEERLQNAKAYYKALMKFKPDTKYKEQADEMMAKIDTELQNFSK